MLNDGKIFEKEDAHFFCISPKKSEECEKFIINSKTCEKLNKYFANNMKASHLALSSFESVSFVFSWKREYLLTTFDLSCNNAKKKSRMKSFVYYRIRLDWNERRLYISSKFRALNIHLDRYNNTHLNERRRSIVSMLWRDRHITKTSKVCEILLVQKYNFRLLNTNNVHLYYSLEYVFFLNFNKHTCHRAH